jgi:hypothetical protein
VHDEVAKVEKALKENWEGGMELFIHCDPCIPEKCCNYCQIQVCNVRKQDMNKKIEWTATNMSKNQKHFHELNP